MALIPPVTRLTPSIIRILGCNPGPMTLQGTNTYLVGTGEKRILIDAGDADIPDYIKHLNSVLKQEKATISTIILTHWHHDHVGGVNNVLKTCADKNCQVFKFPRTDDEDEITKEIKVGQLKDNQEFVVEGGDVKIYHTPGHTTDHVILITAKGQLFSGDCILGDGTAVFEDLFDYMKSLHKILGMKPSIVYPGHGNVIENPIDRIKYYIDHRNQREQQILQFYVDRPQKKLEPLDVVKVVYKDIPEDLWLAAAYNVSHHLKKLVKEQRLLRFEENGKKVYMFPKSSSL